MDNRAEPVAAEHVRQRLPVITIDTLEGHVPPGDFPNALDRLHFGIRQIVDDHDIVSRLDQLHGRMSSDIAGPPGNQYTFFHYNKSFLTFRSVLIKFARPSNDSRRFSTTPKGIPRKTARAATVSVSAKYHSFSSNSRSRRKA